jgi:RimJ/RimL family protein N-acetyltransferase
MERVREFIEPDLVHLSQGLVSLSTAKTHESAQVAVLFQKNKRRITNWQTLPKPNTSTKVFNIFWGTEPVGQLMIEISTTEASISYWVDESYNNRGVATQAVLLITDYVLHTLHLPIEAYVHEDNKASIRVLNKAGFIQSESLYVALMVDGKPVEHLIYRIEQ